MTGTVGAVGRESSDFRALLAEPYRLKWVLAVVIGGSLAWGAGAVAALRGDRSEWAILALVTVLAVGFEEGSRRLARLQIRLTPLRADMTSVWIVMAGLALEPGQAVLLLTALAVFMWFRQHRPAGEMLHRKVYSASASIVAALATGVTSRWAEHELLHAPAAVAAAGPIVIGLATAVLVSRAIITAALLAVGVRGSGLLGSLHDNLIEIATPCLGALTAVAVEREPWLAVLVIVPLVTLQRGAVVRELEAAAITDAKTGLLNAVAWEQLAQRELARAERVDGALAVMIIDIDRFKNVNDRFGHLVGDKVLAGIAGSIEGGLREYDGLGRFGGEEFVAVLPDAGEHDALVIAERVRLRVNELTVNSVVGGPEQLDEAPSPRLSVSVGVAVVGARDGARDIELSDLLHAADQALYRAKWNGRNQVQLARRGDEIPEIVKV